MENKIVRHIEVNGITYDVPSIEGYDLTGIIGADYDQVEKERQQRAIEIAKDIEANYLTTPKSFYNNQDIIYIPQIDWVSNDLQTAFQNCRNLKYFHPKAKIKGSMNNATCRYVFNDCHSLINTPIVDMNFGFFWDRPFFWCYNLKEITVWNSVEGLDLSTNTLLTKVRLVNWKGGNCNTASPHLTIESIKYCIFHAMNSADGAQNRTFKAHATPLATWNEETANTTPTADDAEFLKVEDWDRYKKEDGTLYTWGEIASLIKDITIA
jgi:hypothetical protein